MPSKKKKYNSRFPPARIKKIMQTDDDVGKVAAAVPVIISRALELFIESLILKTNETTTARNAKTLTTSHIKQTIEGEKKFDFLRDLVSSIPDHQAEDDAGENSGPSEPRKPRGPRGPRKSREGGPGRKRKDRKSSSESSEANINEDEETETDEEDNNGSLDHVNSPLATSPSVTSPSTSHQFNSPPANIPHPAQFLSPQMPYNSLPYGMPPMSQVPYMPMPSVSGVPSVPGSSVSGMPGVPGLPAMPSASAMYAPPNQAASEDDDYDT